MQRDRKTRPTRRLLLALGLLLPALGAMRCQPLPLPGVDGDVDDDAFVTQLDVDIVLGCLGADPAALPACAAADVDRDGDVDFGDVVLVERQRGHRVCNGAPQLCDRAFDAVAYVTNHNAFATTPQGYFPADNQSFTLPVQLADGVRGLMLDTHYKSFASRPEESVFLCHSVNFCGFPTRRALIDGLVEIKAFLDTHLGEVVTLIFESYVSPADTADVFERAGLLDPQNPAADYLYVHAGGAWPTLGQMLDSGERLVVLTDDSLSASEQTLYPWYHYLWSSLAFETPFSLSPSEFPDPGFTCEDLRGTPGNDLFILNHFLTNVVGDPSYADLVNHNPFFLERAQECQAFQGQIPNFVTVDYHEIGDVFDVVRALNGL